MNFNLSIVLQVLLLTPILGAICLFLKAGKFCELTPAWMYNFVTWAVVAVSFFVPSALLLGETGLVHFSWFPSMGINFSFYADGLSYLAILFTAFVFLIYGLLNREQSAGFYACLLLIETSLIGLLISVNLLVFYFFYELMLFPIFYLMTTYGSSEAKKAAYQFLLYTLAGSLCLLLAIIYAGYSYFQAEGVFSLELVDLLNHTFTLNEQRILFLGFFVAFAVKSPIFPFHTWLPATYSNAPKGLAIIFAGLLFQAGIYGLFRFNLGLFPQAFAEFAPTLAVLATIGIVYGALLAWRSKSIRGLMAYASISHVGFSILGLATLNPSGVSGGLLQIFSHILIAVGLFTIAYAMERRQSGELITDFRGLASKAPVFSFFVICFSLASISLPLTISFVGEFQVLAASFAKFPIITCFALLGVILGAVYMLGFCQQILFGEPMTEDFDDLDPNERISLASLLVLILILGVLPRFATDLLGVIAKNQLSASPSEILEIIGNPKDKKLSEGLVLANLQVIPHE